MEVWGRCCQELFGMMPRHFSGSGVGSLSLHTTHTAEESPGCCLNCLLQVGRAGRDGSQATCWMVLDDDDQVMVASGEGKDLFAP